MSDDELSGVDLEALSLHALKAMERQQGLPSHQSKPAEPETVSETPSTQKSLFIDAASL